MAMRTFRMSECIPMTCFVLRHTNTGVSNFAFFSLQSNKNWMESRLTNADCLVNNLALGGNVVVKNLYFY